MSKRRMRSKQTEAADKNGGSHAGSVVPPTKPLSSSYLPWFLGALVLGAGSYFYTTSPGSREVLIHPAPSALPESYGLCADHGKIYTVDQDKPTVDCILVRKDRIMSTGTQDSILEEWDVYQNDIIKKFYGNEPKAKKPLAIFDAPPGSIVVPGLADAHAHLIQYGWKVNLALDTAESLEDVLDILEAYVADHPELEHDTWITGMGWDQTRWKNRSGEFPTAADLSSRETLRGRPISLSRVDVHAVWVSPRALELTLAKLPDQRWPSNDEIEGGEIIRDAHGNPTGIFVDNAMALVPTPPWSSEQMEAYLERAMSDALRVGLTSVHDAASLPEYINIFSKMADEGRLPIRVYAMGNSENSTYWGHVTPRLEDYGQDERLNLKSVKLFTDGALGSWGAALLEPYSDKPETTGIMRTSPDALEKLVERFWEDGWGINIHCIGDRANKVVLDIFERVLRAECNETGEDILTVARRRRPRIEHAQIMRQVDLKRAGELGVIASVQPTHATSDMWYAETRLGPKRIKGAYAYQTLLQASPEHVLPLGSDFPVEGINPLLGFYAAVARLDVHGNSPHGSGGWFPGEKLKRAQALKGMTLDAAYASFSEDTLGSLTAGKKADYAILNRDIMNEDIAAEEILKSFVRATVVDGRVAFGSISRS